MDELEVEERDRELRALQVRQEMFRLENTMLTEHLLRVVVSRKGSLRLHLEKLEQEQEEKNAADHESGTDSRASSRASIPSSRGTVRFSSVRSPQPEAVPMSTEEKCEIAEDECAYLQQYKEKVHAENDRVLDDLRAVRRHVKMLIGELRKEKTDFARDVLLLASLNASKKPYSEDILGFIQEKIKRRRNVRDNIKTNNARYLAEISQLEAQFAAKKDLKDIMHTVDFDQIKILNNELNGRTRDRINGIHRFKTAIKGSMKTLGDTQRQLTEAQGKGVKIRESLVNRTPVIQSGKENIKAERTQRMRLHEAVIIALQNQDGPPQPTAMEYMKTQDQAVKLFKEIKTWNVKVEIAELTRRALEKSLTLMRGITA